MFRRLLRFLYTPSRPRRLHTERRLRFEQCEPRQMLDGKADIVFLVDESGSGASESFQEWLSQMAAGVDVDGDGARTEPGDELNLAEKLTSVGIDDVQYGLAGFGERVEPTPGVLVDRFAHSQLMIPGVNTSLLIDSAGPDGILGTSDDPTSSYLNTIFNTNTAEQGGLEDGWDAIEHAIAEYEIRDGAVPIFVLLQGEEGRVEFNDSLTRQGIHNALASKNATLNVMTVGDNLIGPEGIGLFDWEPLFDLSPYEAAAGAFDDIRILGVESDGADGIHDRQHDYHWIDTNTASVDTIAATVSDGLQVSYNGSNTGASGMVGSGKSLLIGENVTSGICLSGVMIRAGVKYCGISKAY